MNLSKATSMAAALIGGLFISTLGAFVPAAAAEPVPPERLQALLPESFGGNQRYGEVQLSTTQGKKGAITTAGVSFADGSQVDIFDYGSAEGLSAQISWVVLEEYKERKNRPKKGFETLYRVYGRPVREVWYDGYKRGTLNILLADRFRVQLTSGLFYGKHRSNIDAMEALRLKLQEIKLRQIEALGKER